MHITIVLGVVIHMKPAAFRPAEHVTGVMKLVNTQQEAYRPLPLPPPEPEKPSPPKIPPEAPPEGTPQQGASPLPEGNSGGPPDAQELIAENMVETDQTPPPAVPGGAGDGTGISTGTGTSGGVTGGAGTGVGTGQIVYLPQHQVTKAPEMPKAAIIGAIVYPPIARRSNREGTAFLELLIDRQGTIRQINILREDPPGWGFGEAAVNALKGKKAKPGEVDGQPVAVRYSYPIRFTLK